MIGAVRKKNAPIRRTAVSYHFECEDCTVAVFDCKTMGTRRCLGQRTSAQSFVWVFPNGLRRVRNSEALRGTAAMCHATDKQGDNSVQDGPSALPLTNAPQSPQQPKARRGAGRICQTRNPKDGRLPPAAIARLCRHTNHSCLASPMRFPKTRHMLHSHCALGSRGAGRALKNELVYAPSPTQESLPTVQSPNHVHVDE